MHKKTKVLLFIILFILSCGKREQKFQLKEYPISQDALVVNCEPGKRGGSIVSAYYTEPKTFNNMMVNERSSRNIVDRMAVYLARINRATQLTELELAKSIEKLDENGTKWRIVLRKGVIWSDGQPFTAEDVMFSARVLYDEKIHPPTADAMKIDNKNFEFIKVDDYTVDVNLPKPFAPFERVLDDFSIIPKHKLEQAYLSGNFENAWNISTDPKEIVVLGPFLLEEYIPGQKITLVRNPNYFKVDKNGTRLPYLDRVIFTIVPDMNSLALRFAANQSDMIDEIRSEDVAVFKKGEKEGNYTVYDLGPTLSQEFIFFNMHTNKDSAEKYYVDPIKQKWFTNRTFRQALSHAIDRKAIINTILLGYGVPQWGPQSEANKLWYNTKVRTYNYDIQKARDMLASIGMTDKNGDGILEDVQGNKLAFTLLTNSGNERRDKIGTLVKDDWRKIGIELTFQAVEFNSLVTKVTNSFDYDAVLMGLGGGDVDPVSGMNVWLSSGFTHLWWPKQIAPATPWEKRVDELMHMQNSELNYEKRKILYDEVQMIISEECPMIYLPTIKVFGAVRNKYGNVKSGIIEHRFFWNLEEWYIK